MMPIIAQRIMLSERAGLVSAAVYVSVAELGVRSGGARRDTTTSFRGTPVQWNKRRSRPAAAMLDGPCIGLLHSLPLEEL